MFQLFAPQAVRTNMTKEGKDVAALDRMLEPDFLLKKLKHC